MNSPSDFSQKNHCHPLIFWYFFIKKKVQGKTNCLSTELLKFGKLKLLLILVLHKLDMSLLL